MHEEYRDVGTTLS